VNDGERIPPANLEAEATVLGAALSGDRDILEAVLPIVRPEHFYSIPGEAIMQTICRLSAKNAPISVLSVAETLRAGQNLEKCGGISYLRTLTDTVQIPKTAAYYAKIVREKALLRGLIHAGNRIATIGYEGEGDVNEAIGSASAELSAVIDTSAPLHPESVGEMLAVYDRRMKDVASYLTPWPMLDALTGGFTGDELIVWASDPAVGKSILAVQLACYIAERYGPVVIFATEMGAFKTMARLIALYSGVSARRQREGAFALRYPEKSDIEPLDEWEIESIKTARYLLEAMPIYVYDDTLTSEQVVAHIRRLNRAEPLKAAFIDTLGALDDVKPSGRQSTHERLSVAVQTLKRCAKEIDIPVHAVHHFSRDNERGPSSGRPSKKRLRDGGNLEGWATTIIFPHRELVNDPETGKKKMRHVLIVDKARDGEEGEIPMRFEGAKARWYQEGQKELWLDAPVYKQPALTG
jgi:replicative DNA helicase